MERFTEEYRARFAALSTTNVSDAMDALGIHGATYGIRPMWHTMEKVLGPAVTLKMTAAGQTKGKYHLGVRAIDAAEPGDVIVVDNGGRIDTSCWGGVLATGASVKGISGVVIDGACRDLDDCVELNFPVLRPAEPWWPRPADGSRRRPRTSWSSSAAFRSAPETLSWAIRAAW